MHGSLASGTTTTRSSRLPVVLVACLTACAPEAFRPFPLKDPLWTDPDANPIAAAPQKSVPTGYANEVDQTVLRPLSHGLSVPLRRESLNVNSLDEVPDSTWFTNRMGLFDLTPEEVSRGACGTVAPLASVPGPWVIVSGKANGSTPGLVVKAPDGERYLLKMDGAFRGPRASAADVVASRIYWAAGFQTPCNEIVRFTPDVLILGPKAKTSDRYGRDIPLTRSHVDQILSAGWRESDGRIRAMASRYIKGMPVGPFRYEGTRDDDPNDVIPHERRRELRAGRLFAAWLHHWDASENNTLDVVVSEGGRSFVRHYILDWGDALGDIWAWTWPRLYARAGVGRGGYLDLDQTLVDLATLGLYPRPWYAPSAPEAPETFGYFGTRDFVSTEWRGTLPNPAFQEMSSRDAAWAARIISRFTDRHLEAIVARAELDAEATSFLQHTLAVRRDVILRENLNRWSSLDRFSLEPRAQTGKQALCFEDTAMASKIARPETSIYRLQFRAGVARERLLGWRQFRPSAATPSRSCVDLPFNDTRPADLVAPGSPDDDPLRHAEVLIDSNQTPSVRATARAVVHVYDLGPARGFRLVGVERQPIPVDRL